MRVETGAGSAEVARHCNFEVFATVLDILQMLPEPLEMPFPIPASHFTRAQPE